MMLTNRVGIYIQSTDTHTACSATTERANKSYSYFQTFPFRFRNRSSKQTTLRCPPNRNRKSPLNFAERFFPLLSIFSNGMFSVSPVSFNFFLDDICLVHFYSSIRFRLISLIVFQKPCCFLEKVLFPLWKFESDATKVMA